MTIACESTDVTGLFTMVIPGSKGKHNGTVYGVINTSGEVSCGSERNGNSEIDTRACAKPPKRKAVKDIRARH